MGDEKLNYPKDAHNVLALASSKMSFTMREKSLTT